MNNWIEKYVHMCNHLIHSKQYMMGKVGRFLKHNYSPMKSDLTSFAQCIWSRCNFTIDCPNALIELNPFSASLPNKVYLPGSVHREDLYSSLVWIIEWHVISRVSDAALEEKEPNCARELHFTADPVFPEMETPHLFNRNMIPNCYTFQKDSTRFVF